MQKGWNVEGKLTPLYARHGGGKGLAALTGIGESSIRAYNSGKRNLGIDNARKIVATTDVTWTYLGIPDPDGSEPDRVDELARDLEEVRQQLEGLEEMRAALARLEERLPAPADPLRSEPAEGTAP